MDGPEPPVPALATLLVFLQLVRLVLQRQRRQQELVAEVVRCLRAGRRAARRRVWRRPRSTVWWTEVVPTFDAATFVENFRVNWRRIQSGVSGGAKWLLEGAKRQKDTFFSTVDSTLTQMTQLTQL